MNDFALQGIEILFAFGIGFCLALQIACAAVRAGQGGGYQPRKRAHK